MRVYYKTVDSAPDQGILLATHRDDQDIDASVYGENVKVLVLPSNVEVDRIGAAPTAGMPDFRPFKLPSEAIIPATGDKAGARKSLLDKIQQASNGILSQYPQAEILSWATKEAAAKLYQESGDASLSQAQKTLLEAELSTAGGTMEDLCTLILLNAERFSHISGFLAGLRQSTNTKIDAATSQADLNDILKSVDTAIAGLLAKI